MFNLLPESLKKELITNYKIRLFIVLLVVIVLVEFLLIWFVFPSWALSQTKKEDVVMETKRVSSEMLDAKIERLNNKIKDINKTMSILNTTMEYPKLTSYLENILAQKTKDIKINEFNYVVNSENTGVIVLTGVSSNRDSLVSFVKKMENIKLFSKINLPISNLAKDKNLDFSISLNIEEKIYENE